jgi:hypothetical protein
MRNSPLLGADLANWRTPPFGGWVKGSRTVTALALKIDDAAVMPRRRPCHALRHFSPDPFGGCLAATAPKKKTTARRVAADPRNRYRIAARSGHPFFAGRDQKFFFVAGFQPPRGNHEPASRRTDKPRVRFEGPQARGEVVAWSPNTPACSALVAARFGCDGGITQCYQ